MASWGEVLCIVWERSSLRPVSNVVRSTVALCSTAVLFARGSSTSCFKKHCSKSIISGCFCWRGVSATIAHHVAERARRKTGYATQSCGTINCVQALEYLRDRVIICGHGRFHQSIPKRWIWNGPTLLEPLIKLSNLDKNLS